MRPADTWKDYELLDATDGNRLERWGETLLVRPDPQVVWKTPRQSLSGPRRTPFTTAPIRRRRVGVPPPSARKVEDHLWRRGG